MLYKFKIHNKEYEIKLEKRNQETILAFPSLTFRVDSPHPSPPGGMARRTWGLLAWTRPSMKTQMLSAAFLTYSPKEIV